MSNKNIRITLHYMNISTIIMIIYDNISLIFETMKNKKRLQ
jgi:hypothetical protein